MNNHIPKLLLTVAVIAAGAGFLIFSSSADAQYYKTVDQLMVKTGEPPVPQVNAKWIGKTLRVHGYVVAGSIEEKIVDQKTVRTFRLENKGHELLVKHTGPKPDTFKDLSEVVAKGTMIKEGDTTVLDATELMAKCPSKYEGAPQNRNMGKENPF